MLQVNPRPSARIESVERVADALLLHSSRGTLRIAPVDAGILRVSFAEEGTPTNGLPPYFLLPPSYQTWQYEETGADIILRTPQLTATVNRETASLRYENASGLLLSERATESRTLEPFDAYRMVVDKDTVIEEIETPDGIKKIVKQANRVFDRKLYHTRLHLQWQDGEGLYGLGQHEEGILNLRGTTQYLHQANMKIAVPFLVSTKGYGLLLATGSAAIFSDTAAGSYLYTEADPQMDFFFIAGGSPAGAIAGYRRLTGKASLLPRWAMGYIQSQERYETQQELIETARRYRALGIGLDALVLDWCSWKGSLWGEKQLDRSRFPEPAAMLDALHAAHVHFMISIWPNMNEASSEYHAFLDRGLLLPASNIYNALSPEGRALYWQQAREGLFQYGVDAWWCDSSEPVTPEWSHRVRPEPSVLYSEYCDAAAKVLPTAETNAYTFYHAQAMYEGQRSETTEKRVINLTRSGYTGQQRFGVILWSGDMCATWDTLRAQIPAGLNLCAAGLPYWTLDAGGFFVKRGMQWFWDGDYDAGWADLGYKELAVRWFQYAALLPVFRGHGTDIPRNWWEAGAPGDRFYDALIATNRLRYRLLPYLYSAMGGVWYQDDTMMRPLAFDFPQDTRTFDIRDQYLLGDSLMVCPVTEPMYYGVHSTPLAGIPETRAVYLPAGCDWVDFWTYKRYTGGQTIVADAPLERIPLYCKAGAIIPVLASPEVLSTEEAATAPRKFLVFPGADGDLAFYDDAGDGNGYEHGEYCLTPIHWDDAQQKLTFGSPQGSYTPAIPPQAYTIEIAQQEAST